MFANKFKSAYINAILFSADLPVRLVHCAKVAIRRVYFPRVHHRGRPSPELGSDNDCSWLLDLLHCYHRRHMQEGIIETLIAHALKFLSFTVQSKSF